MVRLAMRYQSPDLKSVMSEMQTANLKKLIVIPFFPQYASATTGSVYERVMEIMSDWQIMPSLSMVSYFYQHPIFAKYFADKAANYQKDVDFDYYLFSYHGVPERHIRKSDVTKSHCKIDGQCCQTPSKAHEFCYRHQCYETTRQVAEFLGLKEGTYGTSFQSRLGRDPWLQPYTDTTIDGLAQKGIKNLAVVTPAFVSDCLETLEEIGMEAAHSFKENGGENFYTVPCLNDNDNWVKTLSRWIDQWGEAL